MKNTDKESTQMIDLTKPVEAEVTTPGGYTYKTHTCPCCGYNVTQRRTRPVDSVFWTCDKVKRCGWDSRSAV